MRFLSFLKGLFEGKMGFLPHRSSQRLIGVGVQGVGLRLTALIAITIAILPKDYKCYSYKC